MRILIDTNIIISGLFFHGLPRELISELDFKKFQVCINNEIFDEYRTQIDKKVLKPQYHLDRELRKKFLVICKVLKKFLI